MVKKRQPRWNSILFFTSVLAFIGESHFKISLYLPMLTNIFDYFVILILLLDIMEHLALVKKGKRQLNILSFVLALLYFYHFIKIQLAIPDLHSAPGGYYSLLILRSIVIYLGKVRADKGYRHYLQQLLLNPAQTMALTYAIVIFIGSLLLHLDISKSHSGAFDYIDALFLSVSATCVTGLSTVSIASSLSFYGQTILLILMQIGGVGILLFSYIILLGLGGAPTLPSQAMLSYLVSEDDLKNITGVARKLLLLTFLVEAIGTIFLYYSLSKEFGFTLRAFYIAFFHTVSALCNIGFTLFDDNLYRFRNDYHIISIMIILMVIGSLGFTVLINCYSVFKNKVYNNKKNHHKIVILSLNSCIVLKGMIWLSVIGVLLFYFFEHQWVLRSINTGQQYIISLFQVISLRTSGFTIINIGQMRLETILVFCIWMFIGGASGSFAGGVKVTTIAVAYAGIVGFIRNKVATIGSYHILDADVRKALIIIVFSLSTIMMATILLSLTESNTLEALLFEVVAAFSTTGISLGITQSISDAGKVILIILMFLGRIGTLTIFSIFQEGRTINDKAFGYPSGKVMIG